MPKDRHSVTVMCLEFQVRSASGLQPLRGDLRYDPADPFAVSATYQTRRGPVEWLFYRDMLADGLLTPTGEGDVRMSPTPDPAIVLIELNVAERSMVIEAPAYELAEFLDRAYQLVPPGTEAAWFDMDAELEKLTC